MKTLLIRLFIENWQRKLISLILAMIIWMMVQHSMTITKTVQNIPVRVTHLPSGKTIEGMQAGGLLNKKISLTVTGNKAVVDDLTGKELEVAINASGKTEDWSESISKKHLVSLSPDLDISKMITRVAGHEIILKPSKLVTEKIPVHVTTPIGEPPKGYQYLDVWPYHLYVTVTGPEEAVKRLKTRGYQLTFNLNEISLPELDTLHASKKDEDEVSFFVPNAWKKVFLPMISETHLEIDDPQAKTLRIDFSRRQHLPIEANIPVTVFFPQKHSETLNPETYSLASNDFIIRKNGIKMITAPLYVQGVSPLFLEIVKDMIQIVVIAAPKSERETLTWNIQFMYPHELEDHYVARVMSESTHELADVQPHMREDYLRNRFRSYMNRFRLYTANQEKLSLQIELLANSISVTPLNLP